MGNDAEYRFKRTMDRLFSSPAASSSGDRDLSQRNINMVLSKRETTVLGPMLLSKGAGISSIMRREESSRSVACTRPRLACRPWERADLFRRLATFKSLTWFGKPEAAGPVNCARRGWVNTDVDLIACETCNAMLSFPCPPTWSPSQAESAAESFSDKLDSGHKDLCPWKGNACADTLAQFPPAPAGALIESFQSRCDELYKLCALPAISSSVIDFMKVSKSSHMDRLLSQPPCNVVTACGIASMDIENKDHVNNAICTYYQTLTLIALCGWELRLLPYTVDIENDYDKNEHAATNMERQRHLDPGPSVLMCSKSGLSSDQELKQDVTRAVLDCGLCGASVGLWLFSVLPRPMSLQMQSVDAPRSESVRSAFGFSAVSIIEQYSKVRDKDKLEVHDESNDGAISILSQVGHATGCLDLNLTIAGGPRPTRLSSWVPYDHPCSVDDSKMSKSEKNKDHSTRKHCQESCALVNQHGGWDACKRKRYEGSVSLNPVQNSSKDHSSVDAMDTCFQNRQENSTEESVEMPQEHRGGTPISSERPLDGISTRSVRIMDVDTLTSVGEADIPTTFSEQPNNGVPSSKASKGDALIHLGSDYEFQRELREGNGSDLTTLWEVKKQLFDPLLQHRYFCPWVNANLSSSKCATGWQLTLDALEAAPSDVEPETASSIYNVDPLTSVRKIFGKANASMRSKSSGSKG